jgi:hypothetical protein
MGSINKSPLELLTFPPLRANMDIQKSTSLRITVLCDIPNLTAGVPSFAAPTPSPLLFKNGNSAAYSGSAVTQVPPTTLGPGYGIFDLNATDTNTDGELIFLATDAGGNIVGRAAFQIVEYAPATGPTPTIPDPWVTPLPGAYPPGQAGYILGHEGAGSDPWATPLPGAYPSGQAGNIVGKNLDAAVKAVIYLLTKGNPPAV